MIRVYNGCNTGKERDSSTGGKEEMKTLVIGGVAAGTKAAAKLKREDRSAEVTLLTKAERSPMQAVVFHIM